MKNHLPAALKKARKPRIDGRSAVGRAKKQTALNFTTALGGSDHISPQQAAVIDLAAEAVALRRQAFANALLGERLNVGEFVMLSNVLIGAIRLLGMNRVAKRAQTLAELIAAEQAELEPDA